MEDSQHLERQRDTPVIPAKAGIHLALAASTKGNVKVDPGVRRDDDERGEIGAG
jgi:hypothetical protein